MTIAFPTGKAHVSFSEVRTWAECPWKHKLTYIDKVKADVESEHLYFGTAVHASCEKYLKKQKELMEDFIWNKMNKNNQNK